MKRVWTAALAVAVGALLSACTAVSDTSVIEAGVNLPGKPVNGGEVYLVRGGANVFSTGMDEIAEKLRARGIDAKSVPHSEWKAVDDDLRRRYANDHFPIVLVGHSFGADAEIVMALDLLQSNTPIALMIIFDVTESVKVPPNVEHVIYFASSTVKGTPIDVKGASHFAGTIERIDLPEDHLSMDNSPRVQEATIAAILKVIKPAAVTASH